MTGNLKDKGRIVFPPNNQTNWGGKGRLHEGRDYWNWLRSVSTPSKWDFSQCVVTFPEKPGAEAVKGMQDPAFSLTLLEDGGRRLESPIAPCPHNFKPSAALMVIVTVIVISSRGVGGGGVSAAASLSSWS